MGFLSSIQQSNARTYHHLNDKYPSIIVKKRDTVSKISVRFFASKKYTPRIVKLNRLKNKHRIFVGQRLKLPLLKVLNSNPRLLASIELNESRRYDQIIDQIEKKKLKLTQKITQADEAIKLLPDEPAAYISRIKLLLESKNSDNHPQKLKEALSEFKNKFPDLATLPFIESAEANSL